MSNEKSLTKFEDMRVIGELPPRRIASKLRQMGDPDTADEMMQRTSTAEGAEAYLVWVHLSPGSTRLTSLATLHYRSPVPQISSPSSMQAQSQPIHL